MRRTRKLLPDFAWLLEYKKRDLRGDIIGGLTIAVMLIPQAMAYALLAGLPPIVGLYASVVPLLAYAIMGSSRQLAVGPVAIDSLLTAATIGALAEASSARYVYLAALLALLVGAFQIVLGAIHGGFLVNFLSRPVVNGFTSAAAVLIAASQVGSLLGLDVVGSSSVLVVVGNVVAQLHELHVPTAALGAVSMVVIVGMKRWLPRCLALSRSSWEELWRSRGEISIHMGYPSWAAFRPDWRRFAFRTSARAMYEP